MAESRLIVGLGNPGKQYENTRHNLGFLVVRRLAEEINFNFSSRPMLKGLTAEGIWESKELILLLPATYMNQSGAAVKACVVKKAISCQDILVVGDDLNLDFGKMRLRAQGTSGGHHGLESIIEALNTDDFARLRLGIGLPPHMPHRKVNKDEKEVVNFVLGGFNAQEKKGLKDFVEKAAQCCLLWIKQGIHKAMSEYNQ